MRLYEEYFCPARFKLQFVLGKIFREITFHQESVPCDSLKQLFRVAGKLIRDQTEITSIPLIDWQQQMWQRTTMLTDKAVQFATAKKPQSFPIQCCVWEDSVQIPSEPRRTRLIGLFDHVISIESTGSRWNSSGIFPRVHCTGNSRRDPKHDG